MDIFECRGSASVAYGSSVKEIENKKERVLDKIGVPGQPHAVRIERWCTNLLVKVNAPLALIRWLPVNQDDEKGLGYYLYEAGSLKYDSVFREVSFIVEPLKLAKKNIKTKTRIVDIRYNLYISNSEEDLKEASLCERYLPGSVLDYQKVH